MKKISVFMVTLVILLAFGLVLTSCDPGGGDGGTGTLSGTYRYYENSNTWVAITFTGSNFNYEEHVYGEWGKCSGTYTADSDTVTITIVKKESQSANWYWYINIGDRVTFTIIDSTHIYSGGYIFTKR
jgi:hypothetical protein